jgi:hypothetical protein
MNLFSTAQICHIISDMMVSLLDLSPEILTCIVSYFPSLDDIVAFSKTCTAIDALFTEEDWQRAARRFNYGRPNACVENTWKKYVGVLVKHAAKCAFCKGIHADFATIQNSDYISPEVIDLH